MAGTVRARLAQGKVQFDGEFAGHFGVDLHLDCRSGVRAGSRTSCARRCGPAGCAPGSRLPSSRTLAVDLGIARNTVAEAYAQLVAEGWLVARQGSGTWVAERPDAGGGRARAASRVEADRAVRPAARRPGPRRVPARGWLAAARRALAVAPDEALGYGDPRGVPELREQLAGYLARVRAGARAAVAGSSSAPASARRCGCSARCCSPAARARVAVEAFGHRLHRDLIAAQRPRRAPRSPVDDRGAVVDELGDAAPSC